MNKCKCGGELYFNAHLIGSKYRCTTCGVRTQVRIKTHRNKVFQESLKRQSPILKVALALNGNDNDLSCYSKQVVNELSDQIKIYRSNFALGSTRSECQGCSKCGGHAYQRSTDKMFYCGNCRNVFESKY
jgi:ribosomal protein L37AE/L43A